MARGPNKIILMMVICVVLLLQFGLLFSFGATFIALLDEYRADRSRTSIVHSLFLGVGLIFGALGGALIDKIGLLGISVLACVLGPTGFISSYFSTSLVFLYISIGVIGGSGVALVNICCSTAIVRVFTGKQRSMCLSIAYSAPAMSSVVYPNLITVFLNNYGLHGTWLLIGGLFLHSLPLPIIIYFYRDLMEHHVDKHDEKTIVTGVQSKTTDNDNGGIDNPAMNETEDVSTIQIKNEKELEKKTNKGEMYGTFDPTADNLNTDKLYLSSVYLKPELKWTGKSLRKYTLPRPLNGTAIDLHSGPRKQKTLKQWCLAIRNSNTLLGKLSSVVRNKPYITLIVGASFIMGTCNAYVALVFDIAAGKDFTRSQTLLLFIPYAICCTLSRIAPGALEQFKGVNAYIFPLTIIALAVGAQALILFTTVFGLFVVGVCLIGLASGGTLSSVIVLSMNIVKPAQQAIASGLLFTLMGFFSTACTPVFGAVRDHTGSYDIVSYMAMGFFSLGWCGFIVSLILRRRSNQKNQTPDLQDDLSYDLEISQNTTDLS